MKRRTVRWVGFAYVVPVTLFFLYLAVFDSDCVLVPAWLFNFLCVGHCFATIILMLVWHGYHLPEEEAEEWLHPAAKQSKVEETKTQV